MFPSFQIAGMTWYMTGIGIVVAIFVYIVSMWYYTRRYGLSFGVFFYSLPVLIVLTYFL